LTDRAVAAITRIPHAEIATSQNSTVRHCDLTNTSHKTLDRSAVTTRGGMNLT
jgi:hypothetical protein